MTQAAAITPPRMECKATDALTAILGPIADRLGYTRVQRTVRDGMVLSVKYMDPDPDHGMTDQPCLEVYRRDLYPNDKGEIFVYVWNWVGSEGPTTAVADLFKSLGHKARVTKHKGTRGVRVVLNGFDMYAHP
jgi:hypothetical protein